MLAVDPSSARSGGSILGDKTRMARLAVDPNAFIRPSPTSGTLGGVAQATRESMVVVEAAGYDVVLVETVGVGQSEITVAEMVDSFLFLTLARTGDQLQGIKRGILEIADVIAVNKADGAGAADARKAARELAGAIRMLRGHPDDGWDVPVLTCSGLTGEGLDEVWAKLVEHQDRMKASGEFDERRRAAAGALDLAAGARRPRVGAAAPPRRPVAGAAAGEGGAGRRADPGAGRPADPATPSSPRPAVRTTRRERQRAGPMPCALSSAMMSTASVSPKTTTASGAASTSRWTCCAKSSSPSG